MDETQQTTTVAAVNAATTTSTNSANVQLVIKASNQQFDDHIIESDLLWTVKHLKTQLSKVYPNKPPVDEQKLIYSGQLLNDKLLLKDVLRSYKDVYTHNHIIHLVYTPKTSLTSNKTDYRKNVKVSSPNTTTTTHANNLANETNLRQRNVPQQQQQQQTTTMPQQQQLYMAAATGVATPCPPYYGQNFLPFNMQLMANQQTAMYQWMQQVYSQYMDQCNRLLNANGGQTPIGGTASTNIPNWPFLQQAYLPPPVFNTGGNIPYPVISSPTFLTTTTTATSAVQQNNVPQSANGASATTTMPAQAAPIPAVDEQPRAQEPRFPLIVQEEVDNRDWLDSFFSITRLALFLTILYFNSSPIRCLIVLFIGSFIYLYHIGVLRINRERNNNNINRNNNDNANAQIRQGVQQVQQQQQQQQNGTVNESDENEDDEEDESASDNGNEDTSLRVNATRNNASENAAENHAVTADNANTSFLSTIRTFVITFFTSLLPETPPI